MAGKVDQTGLRFNQAAIILLLLLAFVLDQPGLVVLVTVVMLVGTWWPHAGLFKLFYSRLLRPAGLLKPALVDDAAQPHLFAQGVGGVCLSLALLSFALGAPAVAWGLCLLVAALAAVNLCFGFCLGCFLYYQLARRGLLLSLPGWGPPAQMTK